MKEEEKLVRTIKSDPAAFSVVYDRHYSTIFNYCFRRSGNFSAARDITSEVFLKAFVNFNRFRWQGIPIVAWLYRIATNEVNLYFRSRKYQPKKFTDTYGDAPIFQQENLYDEQETAELQLEQDQLFKKIQCIVITLPGRYQDVLTLRYFESKSIREIAVILNKKEGTVKSLISRGLEKIRHKMQPQEGR